MEVKIKDAPSTKTQVQLKPNEPKTFVGELKTLTVDGQKYNIIRFPLGKGSTLAKRYIAGKGPTLEQSLQICESTNTHILRPERPTAPQITEPSRMLTIEEAVEIGNNKKTNAAFRKVLKPTDWGFIDGLEYGFGHLVYTFGFSKGVLCIGEQDNFLKVVPAPVLILKDLSSEAGIKLKSIAEKSVPLVEALRLNPSALFTKEQTQVLSELVDAKGRVDALKALTRKTSEEVK